MALRLGKRLGRLFLTTVATFALATAASAQVEDNLHQPYKGFTWGYCTYYAAQVFDRFAADEGGIDWRGDGGRWLRAAQEKGWQTSANPRDARIGAIIVWQNAGRGHVAIVDDVYEDGILISEMNWRVNSDGDATGGFNRISQSFLPFSTNLSRGARRRYWFAGYVFPKKVIDVAKAKPMANPPLGAIEAASRPRIVVETSRATAPSNN
ncbi:MAG: hypothetical protein CFK52_07975 [Chloracidobacterium sp. CP2_5A]|nr:MAG: hypothetical protein CFK52_07975 [Chloracidobacterium sp. CP2_5A]